MDKPKEEKRKGKEKSKTKAKSGKDKRKGDDGVKSSTAADILSEPAMHNALLICHNVQDLMFFHGFHWEAGKEKKKKR